MDESGKPFTLSVKDVKGLSALATVRVVGSVTQKDGGVFVVNAKGVWIGG